MSMDDTEPKYQEMRMIGSASEAPTAYIILNSVVVTRKPLGIRGIPALINERWYEYLQKKGY